MSTLVTGRNEVVAKVMFLLVSVILSTAGVSSRENPPARRPPWQGDPPAGSSPGKEVLRKGDPPWHTVNERPIRILLECIVVMAILWQVWISPYLDDLRNNHHQACLNEYMDQEQWQFFQFHAVFGKIWQNCMLALPPPPPRGLAILDPPLRRSASVWFMHRRWSIQAREWI